MGELEDTQSRADVLGVDVATRGQSRDDGGGFVTELGLFRRQGRLVDRTGEVRGQESFLHRLDFSDSFLEGQTLLALDVRDQLFRMTFVNHSWEWDERAKVSDAVVRALLREDILLRLPRSVFKDSDETWAVGILRGLHEPPGGGQLEPLAGRVEEFLRELVEMGPTEREAHLRYAMNPKAEAVALVTGASGIDRDAVFNGFNTPLLPDILVCTQVGQEGIDLHRHCCHVVHYDLGWNPATLEQRTGRTDRLGSKAMRERNLALAAREDADGSVNELPVLPGLDIALPYLAGTYDERMYGRLRSRAQTFEILTGGDPSADRDDDTSWLDPDDLGNANGNDYVPLPIEMLEQLRVNLAVYRRHGWQIGTGLIESTCK